MDAFVGMNRKVRLDKTDMFIKMYGKFYVDECGTGIFAIMCHLQD